MKKLAFKISFGLDYHKQLNHISPEGRLYGFPEKNCCINQSWSGKKVNSCLLKIRMNTHFFPESAKYQLYIPVETGKMWQTVINDQFLIDFIGMNKKNPFQCYMTYPWWENVKFWAFLA